MLSHNIFCCCIDELEQLRKMEAEQDLEADWEIDAFMTADTVAGKREAIVSEYILRILGLEVCIGGVDMWGLTLFHSL